MVGRAFWPLEALELHPLMVSPNTVTCCRKGSSGRIIPVGLAALLHMALCPSSDMAEWVQITVGLQRGSQVRGSAHRDGAGGTPETGRDCQERNGIKSRPTVMASALVKCRSQTPFTASEAFWYPWRMFLKPFHTTFFKEMGHVICYMISKNAVLTWVLDQYCENSHDYGVFE